MVDLPGRVAVPPFTLPDMSGMRRSLSDFAGRPLLINFWAVWCAPCRRELASLAELRLQLGKYGINVVAINLGDSAERIRGFLDKHPAPGLPILLDRDSSVGAAWQVRGLPVTFALGSDGTLALGALGERDWRSPAIVKQILALN